MQTFLVYMPVYHQGWKTFFAKYPEVKEIILLAGEQLRELAPTHKDLHGLPATEMAPILASLNRFEKVTMMTAERLQELSQEKEITVITADDEAVKEWLKTNLPSKTKVINDTVFVRWTKENSLAEKKVKVDGTITEAEIKAKIEPLMKEALTEGEKSSDWWRRVGCILILANGKTIMTHNTHLPEPETPYIKGDVRAQFHKGDHFELTTAIHAEAKAISEAASKGWSTKNATMIVTDFPCPVCAKLLANAGVKTLYFQKGYAMLDGEEVLQAFKVKVIKIQENL